MANITPMVTAEAMLWRKNHDVSFAVQLMGSELFAKVVVCRQNGSVQIAIGQFVLEFLDRRFAYRQLQANVTLFELSEEPCEANMSNRRHHS